MAVFPASGGPTSSTEFPLELDFALANNVTAKKLITAAATERRVKVLVERLPTRGKISGVAETIDVSVSEVQVHESKAYKWNFKSSVYVCCDPTPTGDHVSLHYTSLNKFMYSSD